VGRAGRVKAAAAILLVAVFAATASAGVVQEGNLRITVLGQILPFKLPRDERAPIAVFISGHVDSVDGSTPPQLQRMTVKVNRNGMLQSGGLPVCGLGQIDPASSARALGNCGDALIGSGRFWASVVFPDQRPYPTRGRLLVFNGRKAGRPVLFAHIYTTEPFNTSFVVTFEIREIDAGPYGLELAADFPRALGNWGFVDRIKLTLRRKYTYRGEQLSYFNSSCPAVGSARVASFPLARAGFFFAAQKPISVEVVKSCAVKE
jgi:hypothetical protein